jgi:hypothetical protein
MTNPFYTPAVVSGWMPSQISGGMPPASKSGRCVVLDVCLLCRAFVQYFQSTGAVVIAPLGLTVHPWGVFYACPLLSV